MIRLKKLLTEGEAVMVSHKALNEMLRETGNELRERSTVGRVADKPGVLSLNVYETLEQCQKRSKVKAKYLFTKPEFEAVLNHAQTGTSSLQWAEQVVNDQAVYGVSGGVKCTKAAEAKINGLAEVGSYFNRHARWKSHV